jgi:DNA-binding winged helix-turn-helix (wHTH) protein
MSRQHEGFVTDMPTDSTTDNPPTTQSSRIYLINEILCDFDESTLVVDGDPQRLEPKIAGALYLLVRRGNEVVTRDEFLDSVWGEEGSDEALNQAISRLRRLLGDSGIIETVPRVGYRLRDAAIQTDSPVHSSSDTSTFPFGLSKLRSTYAMVTVFLLIVAVSFVVFKITNEQTPPEGEFMLEVTPAE